MLFDYFMMLCPVTLYVKINPSEINLSGILMLSDIIKSTCITQTKELQFVLSHLHPVTTFETDNNTSCCDIYLVQNMTVQYKI